MSQQSVIPFFDVILQEQLNYGIAASASESLMQIAGEDGCSFLTEALVAVLERHIELTNEQLLNRQQ